MWVGVRGGEQYAWAAFGRLRGWAWVFWGVRGGRVRATRQGGRAAGRGAPLGGCVRVVECRGWCSWNFFEVSTNHLKRCVLEIAASLRSQGEVGSALLGQSTPLQIPCACTLLDLSLSLCWIYSHSFLPCFSLLGNFTKVRSPSDSIQCRGIVEIGQDILVSCWWTVAPSDTSTQMFLNTPHRGQGALESQ